MNSEKIIKNNLKDMNDASFLIVSQRISTIIDADTIIVLDDGKIIDSGTHDKLIESCDIYHEIVNSQVNTLRDGI